MERVVDIKKENITEMHTRAENVVVDGKPALRVIKHEKIYEFDENTYVKVKDLEFHNGIIEVKMLSRLLPDTPDFARGFIGIVYRADPVDTKFEAFYVRPTNGRNCLAPVRKSHGCQYFFYPGYTFDYFREHHITKYEAEADVDLNEWITLKAVIEGKHAEFYLNQNPALIVDDLKHGADQKGAVGIFVDIGTEAFVSDFKVICMDGEYV